MEPTPLWLALLIESIRYRMTKATQKGYAKLWEADLKKKCRSETAGEMASLLDRVPWRPDRLRRPAGHIKKVVAYLQRTTRLNYRRDDIERVCEFLGHLQDKRICSRSCVKLGLKQHPDRPCLNFRAGLFETGKGPFNFGGIEGATVPRDGPQAGRSIERSQGNALLPNQERADLAQRDELRAHGAFPHLVTARRVSLPGPGRSSLTVLTTTLMTTMTTLMTTISGPSPSPKPRPAAKPKKRKPARNGDRP